MKTEAMVVHAVSGLTGNNSHLGDIPIMDELQPPVSQPSVSMEHAYQLQSGKNL